MCKTCGMVIKMRDRILNVQIGVVMIVIMGLFVMIVFL